MEAAMKRRRGTETEQGCLRAWAAHSQALVGRWTTARCGSEERQARRQLRDEFRELLLNIRGLPAALPALPLELTVLYNSLLFTVGASDSVIKGEAEGIRQGLLRVLEACGACGEDLGMEELWEKVLQEVTMEKLQAPLHRLGALQAAWWLAARRLGSVAGLFQLLSTAEDPGRAHCSEGQNEILSMIKAWQVPPEEASLPLVQSAKDLKEILCTAAAFLQGLQELEAGNFPAALSLLQEAAGGFCSKNILAQIYTCLGCCAQQMGKPQTALQHLKRALQVDFQCLPALSHVAAVYRELGETDVELQALTLLYEALRKNPPAAAASSSPYLLMRTELLVYTPVLTSLLRHRHPSEVKYLLAQRCLQDGRVADAVEHYLDFLSLLQEQQRISSQKWRYSRRSGCSLSLGEVHSSWSWGGTKKLCWISSTVCRSHQVSRATVGPLAMSHSRDVSVEPGHLTAMEKQTKTIVRGVYQNPDNNLCLQIAWKFPASTPAWYSQLSPRQVYFPRTEEWSCASLKEAACSCLVVQRPAKGAFLS
ncbi:Fanconi anemia group G protein isoform X5 [Vidua chalybeata]|uniref:Fanconi anemia group G protein isoform X5 n=1 Tax=Vidua chalybeata TaxID=81927 RepID=UPI0023A7E392|nr:Fanconi anemia group G protein isoform X5 [Vidua chalybeata]